ncbi:hypothetical protein W59_01259 [Rhodococcus opacus RKJ300 = JCM 13270]|uniref:ADP ribosyltransferase domain-containing protein n=1 Tax=Rhodococcus opacus RKJ300 = JCM 13270 TaxID=1165867 RepID=I0WZE0_RHOOP|nr:hypothetical protein W59_01259 [Rhodococcus opacus RKJ300 = JCM 13270]
MSPDAPPSRLDPEAGASITPVSKSAGYRPAATYADRAVERDSARELDRMVEDAEFTRARKDLERAFPRATVPEVSERKRRALPIPDSIRLGLSSRQRKVRSVNKHRAQSSLPKVGYTAVRTLIDDLERWNTVGESLSTARGDAQQLEETMRSQVQRVDRAIQTAERFNDRGHIVYCAVSLPHAVPREAVNLPSTLQPGSRLDFDRHTMATHAVHELDSTLGERDVVFEIETGRGMYLGRSDSVDDTAHLLPRGMRFEVVSAGEGRYRRPDGSIGRRMIVQLRDVTED